MKRVLVCLLATASLVLAADPVDPTGTDWAGAGVAKVSVKKVGKGGSPQNLHIWFPSAGVWNAEDATYIFSGTYTMTGPTTATFDYDPAGTAELEAYLEDTIYAVSGIPVDVTVESSTGTAKFKAKDGNFTGMKYKFSAVLTVSALIGSAPGKFQVKGVGALIP